MIHEKTKIASTFSQKFKGLMGVKKKDFDYCLVFELNKEGTLSASIHMMFMKFPIDIVFLNSKKEVVDMVENAQPWTLDHTPAKPAKFIIELEAESIQKNKIQIQDQLEWE